MTHGGGSGSKTGVAAAASLTHQPILDQPARSPELLNILVRLISLALSLGLGQTALFISERYTCLCPSSEEAVYYHALSLLRCREPRQALEMLKSTLVDSPVVAVGRQSGKRPACEASLRCAYVYAEACATLDRPNEGGECLKKAYIVYGSSSSSSSSKSRQAPGPANIPDSEAAANSPISINIALAKLALQANKPEVAAQKYAEALRAAWWCWEAYEGLCALGRGSQVEASLQPIPVPAVPDPPDELQAHTEEATEPISSTSRRSASVQSSSVTPAPSASTVTPAIANAHRKGGQRAGSTGAGNDVQSKFQSQQLARTASSTPLEAQGAYFQFGEAGHAADNNDISASLVGEDHFAKGSNSDYFNAEPKRKGSFPGGAIGGLFGFGNRSSSDTSALPGGKKLFGSGLLFGNAAAGPSNTTIPISQPLASSSSSSGSFFTPVNQRSGSTGPEAGQSSFVPNGLIHQQSRPPPAIKRNRNQVDVEDSVPSFQLNLRNGNHVNGQSSRASSAAPLNGEADLEMLGDAESYEGKVQLVTTNGNGQYVTQADPYAQSEASAFFHPVNPRAGRKGSTSSTSGAARRSNRINGSVHPNSTGTLAPPELLRKNSQAALNKARAVSNPRERKRSKAGPSSQQQQDDHTNTASSIDSALSPRPYLTSSSPPSTTTSHFEALPPTLASHPPPTFSSSQASSAPPIANQRRASRDTVAFYKQAVQNAQSALAENWLRAVFLAFAKATAALSRFDCQETVNCVLSLPSEQQKCSRAVLLLARAHFENLNYDEADKAFDSARALAPYSPYGMEVYSTLLWHLHRPTQLSFLAQELQSLSPKLPHAWIATGNVFSHLEDHSNALKCFKRAIQVDEQFTYSYTLAGHECITLEEWESATGFFREAIRREPKHYNAWFGLGNVYMKTGKYRMAEYHFRKATEINGNNAMLVCCIGTVLEKLDRKKEALEMYERACLLAPTSPAVRFKRVRMLMDLRQFGSALRDLMIVRELAPDEFNVHYLLGKLYGAMGDKTNMTRSLAFAQDLEPRAAGRIREIIEMGGRPPSDDEQDEEGEGDDGAAAAAVASATRDEDMSESV